MRGVLYVWKSENAGSSWARSAVNILSDPEAAVGPIDP